MKFPINVNDIEKIIGTKEGFFENIIEEDDWSFVIKLHAFFESVCTQLLLLHFQQPELHDIFRRLELSNKTTGKIVFLEKLGFISKENRRYIATLSELRNMLVHDALNLDFKFEDHIKSLGKDKIKHLAVSFSPFETFTREMIKKGFTNVPKIEILKKQSDINNVIKRFKKSPKQHIKIGAQNVVVDVIDSHYYSDYKQWGQADKLLGTGEVEAVKKEVMKDFKEHILKKLKSEPKGKL
jgi:hypothetical protein